ncbi:NAD(+)/NADH kinase [Candidatus Woesearchaeota archaeon]|nr:NAD(+)/NADH kinase [Candidatus Woesearchaeota archaeon]
MKKVKKALVVYYARNYGTLNVVKKALQKNKIAASYIKRESESAIKKAALKADCAVVVGGDGTLLRASHLIESTPVLHVSSNLSINEAFFARATTKDISRKIKLLTKGKYKLLPLLRLEAEINGKKLPFKALNEVYAGSKEPYHTARYKLIIGNKTEEQKSSGILISTPAGSYAWARSAGGRTLSLTAKKMQFVVREPYVGRLTKPKMTKGVLSSSQSITVISNIWERHKGIVVVDSYKKNFGFNNGDKLLVKAAKQPLNLMGF